MTAIQQNKGKQLILSSLHTDCVVTTKYTRNARHTDSIKIIIKNQ